MLETGERISVYSAATYSEAIYLLDTVKPLVLILDGNLSENKSIEYLQYVKENNPFVISIILSAWADIQQEYQFKILGADYFLDKYYQFEKIPEIIDACINRKTQ